MKKKKTFFKGIIILLFRSCGTMRVSQSGQDVTGKSRRVSHANSVPSASVSTPNVPHISSASTTDSEVSRFVRYEASCTCKPCKLCVIAVFIGSIVMVKSCSYSKNITKDISLMKNIYANGAITRMFGRQRWFIGLVRGIESLQRREVSSVSST